MEEDRCMLCGSKSKVLIEYENIYVGGKKLILCYDCYDLNVLRRKGGGTKKKGGVVECPK